MTIDEFIDKVCARPLPQNPMARAQTLAKELAEGAAYQIWDVYIPVQHFSASGDYHDYDAKISEMLINYPLDRHAPKVLKTLTELQLIPEKLMGVFVYITKRWQPNECPDLWLLISNGFLALGNGGIEVTKQSFDLIQEEQPSSLFISYKRSESSAFAMYVLTALKHAGLEAFVDMAIQPGEKWHAELEERIKNTDYLIEGCA